jgi:hypothetical protein
MTKKIIFPYFFPIFFINDNQMGNHMMVISEHGHVVLLKKFLSDLLN